MSRQLPRSPLALVVAQTQFSPIEDIVKYVQLIQESLKTSGCPYFEQAQIQQISISGAGFQLSGMDQWFFTDKKKENNIVLTKNSIGVNTTQYEKFEQYLPEVLRAVENVSKILRLQEFGALERIGLRYLNWIYPLDDVPPEKMLNETYMGGFLDENDSIQSRQVILERKTTIGTMRTVVFKPNDLSSLLTECQSLRLNQPKFAPQDKNFLILDMEHSKLVQGEDFTTDNIGTTLRDLHGELDQLFFEKIPTQKALELWGRKDT